MISAISILWFIVITKIQIPFKLKFCPLWPNHFQPHVMKISGSPLWESLSGSGGHSSDSTPAPSAAKLTRLTTRGDRKPPAPLDTDIPLAHTCWYCLAPQKGSTMLAPAPHKLPLHGHKPGESQHVDVFAPGQVARAWQELPVLAAEPARAEQRLYSSFLDKIEKLEKRGNILVLHVEGYDQFVCFCPKIE